MGYDLSTVESPTAEQVHDYLKAVQTSEYVIPQGRPDLPQDYIDTVEREVQHWKKHGGGGPLSMHCNIWVFGELRQSISQYMNPRLLHTREKRPSFPDSLEFPNEQVNFCKCLVCQKPTKNVCGRCKMVRFCSRDCQRRAWDKSHKEHCMQARNVSLMEALSENGMYLVSPDECLAISKALSHSNLPASVQRKHYFALAAKLRGVFVG